MECSETARQAIHLAKQAGADEAEVVVGTGTEFTAKVRMGKVEVLKEAQSRAMGLRIFSQKRASITSTSDLSQEALATFVKEAVELAKIGEPDEYYTLPEGPFADPKHLPALDLFDDEIPKLATKERIQLAKEAEEASFQMDSRISNSNGATSRSGQSTMAFANSAGFLGTYSSTYQSIVMAAIADDKDGKKRNGIDWTAKRFAADLKTPEEIGKKAAEKAIEKLGARKIETTFAPVVFDPDAGRALLGLLFSVMTGSAIYRRSSYLTERESTPIASKLVTIVDDPHLHRGLGSKPFDGDGLATQKTLAVKEGVLQTFLCDTYSARKLSRKSTANAGRSIGGSPGVSASNFFMKTGNTPPEEIVKTVKQGLYVTHMMGFGFNPIKGDFSRGAAGFWIENGKICYPVAEITISANFNDLWTNIDMVGNDLQFKSSVACPTFRVSGMTIAGR